MILIAVFVITFALVYIIQTRRKAIMLDRLHRATLSAIGAAMLAFAIAVFAGG
jgi:multisubunit Na+/H+ antiporter MnhB subunit